MLTRCSRPSGPLTGLLLLILLTPALAPAQTGTVRVERENLRAAPAGTIIAEVMNDAPLALGATQDRWREATLDGWIWGASVREESEDGHDLVVSASAGENLRAEPNGTIVARLQSGTRLDEVETRDNWIRVRRTAWIWQPSLQVAESGSGTGAGDQAGAAPAGDGPGEAPARPSGSAISGDGEREFVVAGGGVRILESPGGDTLAGVQPGATVEVVAREGDWTRVRIEGWAFTGSLAGDETAAAAVLSDVSAADLAAEPERYRGRIVEWAVQFIALQQAERFRTDFLTGEHFVLARGPGSEPGFVYVAVPPEQLEAARALTPLQRFTVLGRVRSARSALTGAPVLDLMEIVGGGR